LILPLKLPVEKRENVSPAHHHQHKRKWRGCFIDAAVALLSLIDVRQPCTLTSLLFLFDVAI
jgi:hypothetical protein